MSVDQITVPSVAQAVGAGLPAGISMAPSQALTGSFSQVRAFAPGVIVRQASIQVRQGFRVGNLCLMLKYEEGSELTEMPEIYRLPNAPDWFCGIANLHGMLIPVFDLARYLGLAQQPQSRRMLLVLAHGADSAGVVIDSLPERLRWTADESADPGAAPPRLAAHLRGAALIGEQLWFDLECAALLDALEQAMGSLQ